MTNVDIVIPTLFQRKPERGYRTQHGRSWKNLCGHDANMNALRRRHAKNSELVEYKLAGTINILKDLTIKEIRRTWAKIVRKFGEAEVVLWFIREVSKRSNRVHYHLITASDHTRDELKELIRSACSDLKFRLQFEPVKDSKHWANYCCKSTTFNDKPSFHAKKVVLFAKDVGLDKHDTVGDFWKYKPKALTPQQKRDRRERRHRLDEAYNDFAVDFAADALARRTGQDARQVRKEFAEQLVADPASYQSILDIAEQSFAEEEGLVWRQRKVGPFRFTLAPTPPKPPIRRKKMPPKPPPPPFDPARCESFTLGGI